MDGIDSTIITAIEVGGLVVALASAVAAATPTGSDNRVIDGLIRALDAFALNWGSRNPRRPR